LLTKGKWSWTYGRMEARIKIPRGKGLWPAFWMLGANIDSVNWPTCGEIDIMENIGSEPGTVHGTLHGPGYSGSQGIGGPYTLPAGAAVADDFHIFAVEWQTNLVQWFVDGQPYFSVTPANIPSGTTWVFTGPQFILLNVAVGGDWPGSPDGTTTFPQRMTVDYVRVYGATNPATCGGNVLNNPGFELNGLANWTTYGAGFNTLLENVTNNFPIHGGTNVFKVFGQFNGSVNYSGVYQDQPSSPRSTYTASAFALTQSGDRIAGANTAWLEVTFRDTNANILSIYRTGIIKSNTPPSIWLSLPVTNQLDPASLAVIGSVTNLIAPSGTAFVRCQALFKQPSTAGGSVLFDDLNLSTTGTSDVSVPVSATQQGANLKLSFATAIGASYQVRYKSDLTDPNWQLLTSVTGDGTTMSVVDSLNQAQRFYQVARVCGN
jgi:beta-glucanase (GH16 family)